MRRSPPALVPAFALALSLILALSLGGSCGREPPGPPDGGRDAGDAGPTPPPDDGGGLKVLNWNLQFFGDTTQAPNDDATQQSNVTAILNGARPDIAGLVEVVDAARFNALVAGMPGYDGILSSDSTRVTGTNSCVSFGSSPCYTTFEQKLALVYRTSTISVRSAELILTGNSSVEDDFAFRPPLRVDLDVQLGDGGVDSIVVIVIHLKALSDSASWQRRVASSAQLKSYLDANLATAKVAVIGDWNDDLDQSISGTTVASPFQNFLTDPNDYDFVTDVFTQGNFGTHRLGTPIDHQMVTNELLPQLRAGSVQVLHPENSGNPAYSPASQYHATTSDHWPVVSRWEFQ